MTFSPDPPPPAPPLGAARGFVERRRANLRFESHLLAVMSEAVIATDLELCVTSWNRAAETIYGWSSEEALGQPLEALLHSTFLDATPQAAQAQLLREKSWAGLLEQRHKDGHPRVIQALAYLLEDNGQLTGTVTINRDVTRIRQVDEALLRAAQLGDIGDDDTFFSVLVRAVAESLGVSWAILGQAVPGLPEQVQTLAVWSAGRRGENFVYSLEGGPCGAVQDASPLIIPVGVVERYPQDLFLREQGIESYLGVALLDSQGRRRGILVAMDQRPLADPPWLGAILKIYADRASAELERRQALHALERSEARLADALEGANEGVWDWNAVTDQVYFSARWCTMLGHPPEEVGDSLEEWSSRVHPDDLAGCYAALEAHFRGETESYQSEHRVRCKDGSYKWILDRGKVVERGPEGKPWRVVGTHQDITERKTMEAALRTSEARLEMAVNATQEGLWDVDLVRNTFYGSPRWWAIVGLQPGDLPSGAWGWKTLEHPEDLPLLEKEVSAALQSEASTFTLSSRRRHKDGHYLPILTRATIRRDATGKPIRLSGTYLDQSHVLAVMARKEAERSSLELIARSVPLTEILADIANGYVESHPGARAIILLKSPHGHSLRQAAASQLSQEYGQALDSLGIGLAKGVCGTVANTGQRVVVTDIAADPLWPEFKDPALEHGLKACWALPVFSPKGLVLGVLAVYFDQPRTPVREELEFLERCAHLAAVAIQREAETSQEKLANELLERTGQIAQVGGWQLDVATGLLSCSEQIFHIHELEATRPPTFEEAIHFFAPEARPVYAAAVEACLSAGKPWDLELPLVTAQGRNRWIHTQGHAQQVGGRTVRVFGTIQDITQRTQTEKALAASEELHRTLVGSLTEGVLVYDAQGVCITANEQACRIIGAPREELLFKSPKETPPFRLQLPEGSFLDNDELPMHACRVYGKVSQELLLRLVRSDGSAAWILLNAHPLNTQTPFGLRKVVMSFTDITASHEAEQARLETLLNLEELRSVVNQANIYALTDLGGRILDVNEEFIRISGYSRNELIGASHRLLKSGSHPAAFYQDLWNTIRAGRMWRGEIQNRAKDGHLYWVATTIIPLHHPNGKPKGYMVFRQDVTEQHELQKALLQSQKLESVGTLVAGIAHDFNNILMSIGGFTEVLSAAPSLAPKQLKGLEVIRRASERGRVLVSKLLNFSRKSTPQKVQTSLNTTVHETAQLFKRGLAERIRLTLHPAPELPTTLLDPDQIHQVLMNLCVNARDAILGEGALSLSTGQEDLAPEPAAMLSIPPGRYVYAAISDTGQGIPPMVLARMFEPFFTTKGVGKGTGLGLSVVHGIIRSHGGAIQVHSELGVGTTFKIYLPILAVEGELELEPVGPDCRGRLLLVTSGGDLDPGMAELLTALRFELLKMDQAEDWGTQIEWSDAVLLALEAETDWASAEAKLRHGSADVPIIVLTSMEDHLVRLPTLHHPVSAVLASPPRRGELVDTLNSLLPPPDVD